MTRFFSRFYKSWRRPAARSVKGLPAAPLAPDWTPDCQNAWVIFLRSDVGVTLLLRMAALEAQCAIRACQDTFHSTHSAGQASGWTEARKWLESLASSHNTISRSSRVTEDRAPEGHFDSLESGEVPLADLYSP